MEERVKIQGPENYFEIPKSGPRHGNRIFEIIGNSVCLVAMVPIHVMRFTADAQGGEKNRSVLP